MSRQISMNQAFLYLAKHTTEVLDPDGNLLVSVWYEGPYSTIGPARTRKSIAERKNKDDKANNRIGPQSKPTPRGVLWLDKVCTVVRVPFKPEDEATW